MRTFGEALVALKFGKRVKRYGWGVDGYKHFLYFVPEGQYPARTAIAKAEWGEDGLVPYRAYIALKLGGDGKYASTVEPYIPSMTDMLAEDWELL